MHKVLELFSKGIVIDEIAKITGLSTSEVTQMVYSTYITEPDLIISDKSIIADRIAQHIGLDLSKATLESLNGVYGILKQGSEITTANINTKQSIIDCLQPLTRFSLSGLNNLTKPVLVKLLGEVYNGK